MLALAAAGFGIANWIVSGEQPAQEEWSASAISRDPAPDQSRERAPHANAGDLELVGVVIAGRDREGTAIITSHGGPQKSYHIGDPIRAGVVLEEVMQDGAVLAVGDSRQYLSLKRGAPAATSMPPESQATAAEPAPEGVRASSSWTGVSLTPERLSQSLYVRDPDGRFQLDGVKPGSGYEKSGLRAGDVVRSVNGLLVESPDQLMVLHQQLIEGRQGEVEVLREGKTEALRYGGS